MPFLHPTITTPRGTEPGIRTRFVSSDFISYTLTGEDVSNWKQFPLQSVAMKFYENPEWWQVLAEANAIKGPWEWKQGDVIKVPRDYRLALKSGPFKTAQT